MILIIVEYIDFFIIIDIMKMVIVMDFINDIIISEISRVCVVNYKKNEKSNMNIRPWYGIAFSLGGELNYIYGSNTINLSGDRVVLIPQNSTYEVICTKPGSFAVINFLTSNDIVLRDFNVFISENTDILKREFSIIHKSFISHSRKNIYEELSSMYKIISSLINNSLEKKMPHPLIDALKYIDDNIDCTTLSNTQVAKYAGISEVYLRKLFSRYISDSVNSYIQNKRMEKAKNLLIETALSITEISEKCGYSCIYYFCNAFKNKIGCTPTQYRMNNTFNFF